MKGKSFRAEDPDMENLDMNGNLPFRNCVPIEKQLINIHCKWQIKIL